MKFWFLEKLSWRRFIMSFSGTALLGLVVAFLRKSELGTDPWTCFVVGLANVFHTQYGVMYPITIGILIVMVFIIDKHYIGIATVLNLFLVGTVADLSKTLLDTCFTASSLVLKIMCLVIALVILCIASSLYITADLGVSSYDAVALIMKDKLPVQFRWCRIFTDALCTLIGFLCHAGAAVGIGTVITALCMGPFTQLCCVHIAQPLLAGGHKE
jgi:uncharacterized protein